MMFFQTIQHIVDIMIVIMAAFLVFFTLLLTVMHFIMNAKQERMQQIKRRILQLISDSERVMYMKEQVYSVIDSDAPDITLQRIRGIRSRRGIQVLELVVRELNETQLHILRLAVSNQWYSEYLHRVMNGKSKESILLTMKLIGQLKMIGYTSEIESNVYRWQRDPSAQEIGLLALFLLGNGDTIVRILSDRDFQVILSFRSIQEMFSVYSGDSAELYRRLLSEADDQYIRRACIRGIGEGKLEGFGNFLMDGLDAPMNVLLETIRTIGKLKYKAAWKPIHKMLDHDAWEVRCAAIDAIYEMDGDACADDIKKCLFDKDWWVRFHAAEALAQMHNAGAILEEIRAGTDRYALEMLNFIIERNSMLREMVMAS